MVTPSRPERPATRVLLAEDHALVRAGLLALLNRLPDIEVVAQAANGREALALTREHRPDVVLMDISMPELNGLEATRQILASLPDARVLILSVHAEEEYVGQALHAGAVGYLLKDATEAELAVAIRAAALGQTYLSPPVSGEVIAQYVRTDATVSTPLDRLTSRQREILQLIAEGFTVKQIADRLHISPKTVEAHRAALSKRLGVRGSVGLARLASRLGLIGPPGRH